LPPLSYNYQSKINKENFSRSHAKSYNLVIDHSR